MEALDILSGFIWKSAVFIGIGLGAVMILLYFYQDKILYLPDAPDRHPSMNPQGYRTPAESGLTYEDASITSSDGTKLHGWFVPMPNPKQHVTVVYFHENAGNIGTRIPFMKYLQEYCNANVLLMAYRGYSYSEGTPNEAGIKRDTQAVLQYIFSRTNIDPDRIFIFGRSLGGAVGIHGASDNKYPIAGLIIENTFTSISDMVDIVFSKLALLKSLVLHINWKSIKAIPSIEAPILFISGLKDELIPPVQMERLYKAATNASFKSQYHVHHGTHNDTWQQDFEEYFNTIGNFMEKCQKQRNASQNVLTQ